MLKRRLVIALFDGSALVLLAICALVAYTPSAYAYVDPSVMTYAIQAFAGVAVALGAVLGVVMRRSRRLLLKALHIDENANKIVEADVHRLDENGRPIGIEKHAPTQAAGSPSKKRRGAHAAGSPSSEGVRSPRWWSRLIYALIVAVFFTYTVFVVAPLEIVASNGASLIFGIDAVWQPLVVAAALIVAGVTLVLTVLRGRAFEITLLIVFSLGLCAYVQAMFLNGPLPAADGNAVIWSDYDFITAVSAAVWIAIIAIPLVVRHWFSGAVRNTAVAVSLCLILVQSVGVASLLIQPEALATEESSSEPAAVLADVIPTEEGLFDVSPNNNVVVFIVDKLDLRDMKTFMGNDPHMLDKLTGFTYYENTVGVMCPTRWSLPYLLTAQLPQEGELLGSYLGRQYTDGRFLPQIQAKDYSIGLYTDSIGLHRTSPEQNQALQDQTINVHPLEDPSFSLDNKSAVETLWKCALYRDLPWSFKSPFWFYTDEVNSGMVKRGDKTSLGSVAYTLDDPTYYQGLLEYRLSVVDDGRAGSFKLIHLNGAHEPFTMSESSERVAEGDSTRERATKGSFNIIGEYIQQMKDLGLYDTATILVTADHGVWPFNQPELSEPTAPVLLLKPAQSASDAASPVKVSDVPASHTDIHPTILAAMGADISGYNGKPLYTLTDEPRTRKYLMNVTNEKRDIALLEYDVDGDVLDFSSWQKSGRVWESPE